MGDQFLPNCRSKTRHSRGLMLLQCNSLAAMAPASSSLKIRDKISYYLIYLSIAVRRSRAISPTEVVVPNVEREPGSRCPPRSRLSHRRLRGAADTALCRLRRPSRCARRPTGSSTCSTSGRTMTSAWRRSRRRSRAATAWLNVRRCHSHTPTAARAHPP